MTSSGWVRVCFGVGMFAGLPDVMAQQVTAAAQLSPRAAYEEVMHPLEATRKSIGNWSEAEQQALGVAIQRAAAACAAREVGGYSGAAVIDYARLCALGQAWPKVAEAATVYIEAKPAAVPRQGAPLPVEKPLLIQAYAARLDASLHLKDEAAAFADGKAMLAVLPYDGLASEVVDEAIEYMQFTATGDALTLAAAREPRIVEKLRAAAAPATKAVGETGSAKAEGNLASIPVYVLAPTPSIHELYAQGLVLAAIQQFTGEPAAAAATAAGLDEALPAGLSADDTIPIAAAKRRYALLGHPLPQVAALVNLAVPDRMPTLPAFQAITALLLFPDWCTQCVRMGSLFPPSVFQVENHEAYLFGLMTETRQPRETLTPGVGGKPLPRDLLKDTPTLIVAPAVLEQFVATDFPFLVLTDSHGIVRVVQAVDENALAPGGTVDRAVGKVGALWPTTPVKPAAGGGL